MASRYSAGRPLEAAGTEEQAVAGCVLLLVGHHAALHLQYRARRHLPHPLPALHGLPLRLHRCCQHLHVRVRSRQVLLALPLRLAALLTLHHRRAMYDPDKHLHRERRRHLGTFRQKA